MQYFPEFQRIVRYGLRQPDALPRILNEFRLTLELDGHRDQADWLKDQLRRHQPEANEPGRVRPTNGTATKLRRDPVEVLRRQGSLGNDDLFAVRQLRNVFEAFAAGLDPGARAMDATQVDSSNKFRDPAERMGARTSLIIRHVYKPWAVWAYAPVKIGRNRSLAISKHDLVRDVVHEGYPLRRFERHYGTRHGAFTQPLVISLREFSRLYEMAHHEGKLECST